MSIFTSAEILLPKEADMTRWAVIACDQFTSDMAYWDRVRATAADAPSTIHMILPEAELEGNVADKVAAINATMTRYLEEDVFVRYPGAYIYVERTLADGSVRPGLVGAVDLECYDYHAGSVSPIRATEQTVEERIPPRKEIRRNALVELPHVLMLCDDWECCLLEPIAARKDSLQKLYDFDLMEQGGHITGWLLDPETAKAFDDRFAAYSQTYEEKYADLEGAKVLLAVGDGNHSLATAKSCYEELKLADPQADLSQHPARYALVELENIHSPSLVFEPIHRVITETDCEALLAYLHSAESQDGVPVQYCLKGETGVLKLRSKPGELAVAALQVLLDRYLAQAPGKIDYIHDDDAVLELVQQDNAIGFLLPAMEKQQLFRGVIAGGVLPRKTFSMGHAREKRYYLEGRKIK